MSTSDMLLRRYRLVKPIGSGTFATVYMAQDLISKEYYAVKIIQKKWFAQPSMYERFTREVELGMQLQHEHIVKMHSYGKTQSGYYIVMDLIEGLTLREYIKKTGMLSPVQAIKIIRQILSALNYAYHHGVTLHRDLKPENIMIDNKMGKAVVLDFGIAQIQGSSITRNTRVFSLRYAAPEQLVPSKQAFYRSTDLYAVAVMLYEMLTKKTPFRGKTVVELYHQIMKQKFTPPHFIHQSLSPRWQSFFEIALHPDPKERYKDPPQMTDALMILLNQRKESSKASSRRKVPKKSGAGIAAAFIIFFLILSFLGVWAWIEKDTLQDHIRQLTGNIFGQNHPLEQSCFLKIVTNQELNIKIRNINMNEKEFSKYIDLSVLAPIDKQGKYNGKFATNWGENGIVHETPRPGRHVFECSVYLRNHQKRNFYFILYYNGTLWSMKQEPSDSLFSVRIEKDNCYELWITADSK